MSSSFDELRVLVGANILILRFWREDHENLCISRWQDSLEGRLIVPEPLISKIFLSYYNCGTSLLTCGYAIALAAKILVQGMRSVGILSPLVPRVSRWGVWYLDGWNFHACSDLSHSCIKGLTYVQILTTYASETRRRRWANQNRQQEGKEITCSSWISNPCSSEVWSLRCHAFHDPKHIFEGICGLHSWFS